MLELTKLLDRWEGEKNVSAIKNRLCKIYLNSAISADKKTSSTVVDDESEIMMFMVKINLAKLKKILVGPLYKKSNYMIS